MTSPSSALRSSDALLEALERDDLVAASDQLGALCKQGTPVAEIIDDVVAPVMVEVGRRWQTNQWTAAQEHGATATIDAALAAVEMRFLTAPSAGRPIVVACAEGEWHALAARLAAVRLRSEGHRVVFLGPSLPPRHLADHLQRVDALALGLSCTIAVNLIGARRCVDAAHAVGVPVMVGGAAFDAEGRRARAIGADAVAGADDATAFLASPMRRAVPTTRVEVRNRQEAFDVEIALEAIVSAAMGEALLSWAPLRHFDHEQTARTREGLTWIVRFCAAAIDLADLTVFTEFLDWTRAMLRSRDVPDVALDLSLRALHATLEPRFPRTARAIQRSTSQTGPLPRRRAGDHRPGGPHLGALSHVVAPGSAAPE